MPLDGVSKSARTRVNWPVRTHPETGRKALYINIGHTVRLKDMTEAESFSQWWAVGAYKAL
jgi:alpha-ketoglutarate-dependent taurine dioxygenase